MFSIMLFLISFCGTRAPQSYIQISNPNTEFFSNDDSTFLLDMFSLSTYRQCLYTCHQSPFCRIFDYDSLSNQCRLFEGDLVTTGSIGPSNSFTSIASHMQLIPNLFSAYGRPCSACSESRYLRCFNATCSCWQHTYWTGSICATQQIYAGQCNSSVQCQPNLNLTCLQFFQCGPASLLAGTTIFGNSNGSSGNTSMTLNLPWGITLAANDSVLIADPSNDRIILTRLDSPTPTSIIGIGQLNGPSKAMYDTNRTNLYVLDAGSGRLIRFNNGSGTGVPVFGGGSSNLNQLNVPHSFTIDSQQNFYIADTYNHRIILWRAGASNGTVIAGVTGSSGTGLSRFDRPTDVLLDENAGYMYVSDFGNHRVLRFKFNSTNGTVVAGGNGPGTGRHQLNRPLGICLSKKNNALYIVDQSNSRIQRWYLGESQGVTVAGSPNGTANTTSFTLKLPNNVAVNDNATHLFVSDRDNHRIQMFKLI